MTQNAIKVKFNDHNKVAIKDFFNLIIKFHDWMIDHPSNENKNEAKNEHLHVKEMLEWLNKPKLNQKEQKIIKTFVNLYLEALLLISLKDDHSDLDFTKFLHDILSSLAPLVDQMEKNKI